MVKRLQGLNKVHLPLLEMARTIKVSKEKAEKDRAKEAGDKKKCSHEKTKRGEPKESPKDKG